MHSLAAATLSEGLTARTSVFFWISATLQLSRCSPLRSTQRCSAQNAEYGACGPSVKRADGRPATVAAPGRAANARRRPRRPSGASEDARLQEQERRARRRSSDSSASWTEPGAPSGPVSTSVDDEPEQARDDDLGEPQPDLDDELLDPEPGRHRSGRPLAEGAPALERADEGHLVGVLEVAADRDARGRSGSRCRPCRRGARRGTSRSPRPRASGWWRG